MLLSQEQVTHLMDILMISDSVIIVDTIIHFTAQVLLSRSDANTVFLQNFEITNGIAITSNLLSALDSVITNTYTITGPVVLNPNSKFGSSCLEFISEGSKSNVTFTTYPSSKFTMDNLMLV